ncbi:MAG: molybdopterin-synthase adenylyltransferase MoeB [Spirosomataceae bacterium]
MEKNALTSSEKLRYDRQLKMPEFGLEKQLILKKARVLIVGCGGLGSPISLYLAAAGVGTLGLIENDQIDMSNLQRQILYRANQVGEDKLVHAVETLKALNPEITVIPFPERLTAQNAVSIIQNFDLVIDGSDNFPTRYLVNDACFLVKKPWVYGAIYRFEGQVAVFNYRRNVTYRDMFPSPPPEDLAPNCVEAGVLGVMAGLIGTLQATEAIKVLTGIGEVLDGELLLIETLSMSFRKVKIPRDLDRKPVTELIDYEAFCRSSTISEITWDELQVWKKQGVDFQLIDVRTKEEHASEHLGGKLIPLAKIEENLAKIDRDKPVILHCLSGARSRQAAQKLMNEGWVNVYSLQGGIQQVGVGFRIKS